VKARTDLINRRTGKPAPWGMIRRWVLGRDAKCVRCGDIATDVDHKWPRYYGGDDHSSNLQPMCAYCNKAKGNSVSVFTAEDEQLIAGMEASLSRCEQQWWEFFRFTMALAERDIKHRSEEVLTRFAQLTNSAAVTGLLIGMLDENIAEARAGGEDHVSFEEVERRFEETGRI
jgi:hypothetical protein